MFFFSCSTPTEYRMKRISPAILHIVKAAHHKNHNKVVGRTLFVVFYVYVHVYIGNVLNRKVAKEPCAGWAIQNSKIKALDLENTWRFMPKRILKVSLQKWRGMWTPKIQSEIHIRGISETVIIKLVPIGKFAIFPNVCFESPLRESLRTQKALHWQLHSFQRKCGWAWLGDLKGRNGHEHLKEGLKRPLANQTEKQQSSLSFTGLSDVLWNVRRQNSCSRSFHSEDSTDLQFC